jgi:hypothetical protein
MAGPAATLRNSRKAAKTNRFMRILRRVYPKAEVISESEIFERKSMFGITLTI